MNALRPLFDSACAQLIHNEHVSFATFSKHVRELKKEALHFYGTDDIEMKFTTSPSSSGETHEGFLVFVKNPPKNLYKCRAWGNVMRLSFARNAWNVGWIDVAKGYVQR